MNACKYVKENDKRYPYGFYAIGRCQQAIDDGYSQYVSSMNNIEELWYKKMFEEKQKERVPVEQCNKYFMDNVYKPLIELKRKQIREEMEREQKRYDAIRSVRP